MYLFSDYVTPAELTGYVRTAISDLPVNRLNFFSAWLPNRTIDDLDYRFTRGGEGLVETAQFRNYDTPAPFAKRPGAVRVSGSLPPISRQIRLSEYDRLRLRDNRDAIINSIYADAERLARGIAARFELARSEALYSGKVILNENGVVATVDFGRTAGHTVTAAIAWTVANAATAVPLTDMETWADTYETNTGVRPENSVTSRAVKRALQRNKQIIDAIKGAAAGATRVTEEELNDLLESEGFPRIQTNDAQVRVGAVATRVLPSDRFVFLPAAGDPNDGESSEMGATLLGTTLESQEPGYSLEGEEQPGVVAGTYKQDDPVALYTKAAGIGLPTLANPDLSFAADVQ